MTGPAARELARYLAAVRNGMSAPSVRATAFELADALADGGYGDRRQDRILLERILRKGAEAVKRDGDV